MGAFDPDAWLAERRAAREKPLDLEKATTEKPAEPAASTGFDPDAWLASRKAARGEAVPEPTPVKAVEPPPAKKEVRPEDQNFLRQVADVPLKVGSGVVSGVRMVADAMGADSAVSKNLRGAEDWIAELYSAQSKKDSKRMAEIMKAAEDQGAVANIIAALNAFKEAPVDLIAQGLGTAAPGILTGIATFVAGAPVALATAASLGVGTVMGAGTVKSAIYDATKQTLAEQKDLKLSPKQIEEIAVKAQEYGGKNTDMILGGMILGALGSYSGAEPIIARELGKKIIGKAVAEESKAVAGTAAKQTATDAAIKASQREATELAAKRGMLKNASVAGGKEFLTEFGQGGQEQLAQNIALQREGFDVPTMRGVVGQGTLEGLAGLGMGAPAGAIEAARAKRELAEEKAKTEGEDPSLKNVLTTGNLNRTKAAISATADDINTLVPATDKAGKALTDIDPDTQTAKTKADTEAAAVAAQTKISLDEAAVKANEIIAKADAGEKLNLKNDIRPVAKALGVKLPFAISSVGAIKLIRDHLGEQGTPDATATTVKPAKPIEPADRSGTELAISAEDNPEAGGGKPAGSKPSRVVSDGTTVGPTVTGEITQPSALDDLKAKRAELTEQRVKLYGGSDRKPSPKSKKGVALAALNAQTLEIDNQIQKLEAETGIKTAAEQDEDLLNDLLGGGSTLSARRTNAEISRDEQLNELGKKYGLTRNKGEGQQSFGTRLRNAVAFEKKRLVQAKEGAPGFTGFTNQELASQEVKDENAYQPSKDQIEAYEENRQYYNENIKVDEDGNPEEDSLPAYKELSPAARLVYFQNNIPLGSRGTAKEHAKALRELSAFRSGEFEETGPYQLKDKKTGELQFNEDGTPMMVAAPYPGETRARETYNDIRGEYSQKTGLAYAFPAWNALSDASKKIFLATNKNNTAIERDLAFRLVKRQIREELAEQAAGEVSQEQKSRVTNQLGGSAYPAADWQTAVAESNTENSYNVEGYEKTKTGVKKTITRQKGERARTQKGVGEMLPNRILKALFNSDIKTVLDYIREHGNGKKLKKEKESFISDVVSYAAKVNKAGKYVPARSRAVFGQRGIKVRDSVAMNLFRLIAERLGGIENFNVKVVYDPNLIYNQLAFYDSKNNTIFVGPNGLDEGTILHELVHAATVKIIHQYFTDPSVLPAHMRKAVDHLIVIAGKAESVLGSKHADKFEDLYEFIAYAMTDPDFQYELAQIQVGSLATVTDKNIDQSEAVQLERESVGGTRPMNYKSAWEAKVNERTSRGDSVSRYDSLMDNLWNSFTGALASMYKLFTPNAKKEIVLLTTEKSGFARKRTAEEVAAGEELEKAARKGKERGATKNAAAEQYNQRMEALESKREISANSLEALSVEELFNKKEEEYESNRTKDSSDYATQYGVTNLRREPLRTAGYKGNLLLETAEMFQMILAAPEGGIAKLAGAKEGVGSQLSVKDQNKPPAVPREGGGIYKKEIRDTYALSVLEKSATKTKEFLRRLFTNKGWRETFTQNIDRTLPLRIREQQYSRSGLLERDPTKSFNNIVEHLDNASGKARQYLIQYIHQPMMELQQSIAELAKVTKQDVEKDILPTLHMLAEAFGEPEKRHMKWLLSVPLSLTKNLMHNGKMISAAQRRIDLMGDPRTGKPGIVHKIELTEAQQKQVRAELEALAKGHVDPLGDSPRIKNEKIRERALTKRQKKNQLGVMDVNEDSSTYNVLGINKEEVELRLRQFEAMDPAEKEAINKVMASIRKLTKNTSDLNKIGNYWSYPVTNIVGIYDYQNYMPFKGLAKHSIVDEMIEPDGGRTKTSRILIDEEKAAHGRFTVSDNPILQTMSDAARAAGRAGRAEFMQAVLNASNPDKKKNPNGTGIIDADVVERVEFADKETTDLSKYKGKSHIFVHSPDGSLSIIKVNEPDILKALRYQYKDNGFLMDLAAQLTSKVGSMHTRWNMNFAAKNFVSDTLQNAWNIGAGTVGPLSSLKYLIDTASTTIAKNGLGKSMEVAMLYENGDDASNLRLREMAAKDEFVAALLKMLKFGGKTAYIQSMSLKSSLDQLEKEVTKSGVTKSLEAVGKVADVWGSMFEFTSRAAAFQLFEREYLKREIAAGTSNKREPGEEMSPAEYAAAVRAAADTKNLTNFELVGSADSATWMSTFYMFFKASAVSSLRTMESLSPMFRRMDWEEKLLPQAIRDNPTALNNWRKEYKNLQGNAQIMFCGLAGFGYALYVMSMMMAPEDEWRRNATKTDNMDQWIRYARFHLPPSILKYMGLREDTVLQAPWGFGLGAIASTGAQIAGMVHGETSLQKGLANIAAGSLADAFFPLPVSKMPWSENWRFAIADTITPSLLRPYFEYLFNIDGVGRAINSTSNRRLGDAYTGSDRVPLMYKDISDKMFRVSNGDFSWSPNTIHFFANSYIDGIARLGEVGYSLVGVSKDEKTFNPKTDLPLFGSFFGAKSNVDAREYSSMESQIKKMDKTIYTLEQQDPAGALQYEAKNPFNATLVEMYRARQGELNKLRQKATEIRTDRALQPSSKEAILKIITFEQNVIKHEMVEDFKAYGLKP
jgi:hypothetical protein